MPTGLELSRIRIIITATNSGRFKKYNLNRTLIDIDDSRNRWIDSYQFSIVTWGIAL
jgi:hypothetical protein